MPEATFPGRLGVQQRVLPAYRVPFFDRLAGFCQDGMSVFAGRPRPAESIRPADRLEVAEFAPARNRHFFQASSPFYLCWQSGLAGWLNGWQPDVLIAEANPRILSTRMGANWMRSHGRPVLGWGLGAPQGRGSLQALRSPGRSRFYNLFDGVIAYSQRGADEYRAAGFPTEKVFVAPNAVSPPPEGPPPYRPAYFQGRPKALFVGRLQARKRIDNLLQACAALPDQLQPELWVVGDGFAREALLRLAAEVYPRAEFPGALHGPELETRFQQADLFVLPGTGGLAVQEAMTHGLPVIAAEGDGTQDDLVRPENGWQVPTDDLDGLIEALRQALSDAGRLSRMGRESYRIVQERVNIQHMVEVFIRAARMVLESQEQNSFSPESSNLE